MKQLLLDELEEFKSDLNSIESEIYEILVDFESAESEKTPFFRRDQTSVPNLIS